MNSVRAGLAGIGLQTEPGITMGVCHARKIPSQLQRWPKAGAGCFIALLLGAWPQGRAGVPSLEGTAQSRPATVGISSPGNSDPAVTSTSPLPAFDFTTSAGATEWKAAHDIARLAATAAGLRVDISGGDPYLYGPQGNYPVRKLLWMHVRLKSDEGGTAQVFYYTTSPSEANSVRFSVPAGEWSETQIPMPALGSGYSLRIDPPGSGGTCLLARLWFEERVLFPAPAWPRPEPPVMAGDALQAQSGDLKLTHNRTALGSLQVAVAGQIMAVGNTRALLGYVIANQVRWLDLNASKPSFEAQALPNGFELRASWQDSDGGRWGWAQRFVPRAEGSIDCECRWSVDQDRSVLYLPIFTLLPGLGSYGTNKNQALLPGIEYLENEPSSSEADVTGPGSWRQVPDTLKLTFPMMALQTKDRYVGMFWEPQPSVCAVFDSPDRQFQSGGHLLGLLFPGSNGANREERSLLPYRPEILRANQPLVVHLTLIGGRGNTVVPAVQQYVSLVGLPPVPQPGYTAAQFFELAARGWIESRIRETNRFRHAWAEGFTPQPAADAALWMFWLSGQELAPTLTAALSSASAAALNPVPPQSYNAAQIGHIHYPLPSAIFGAVLENARQAKNHGMALLNRFQPDGSVLHQPSSGGVNYGKTHFARDANGLTASVVLSLLEAASFSGDRTLLNSTLGNLRAMGKFRNTVPRGAQTWEVPLHTPDILAAGYLVRAYTLGYELTGDPDLLEQARYWAWTGVPFVYLHPPTPRPVGLYGTIPVLGATGWVAPLWIGLPVQWCGLVYADALYRFLEHDPGGPWLQLADGITASGIQQTWPLTDPERKGLLPDSYQLRSQGRNGPAINPATVQVPAIRFYRAPAPYQFRVFQRHGLRAHIPGALEDVVERADGLALTVRTWSPRPCGLLINGFTEEPAVKINGKPVPLTSPHAFQSVEGRLLLSLEQTSRIELSLTTRARGGQPE
jgi:hypothetical protein